MARIVKAIRKTLGTRVDGKMVKKKSDENPGKRRSDRIANIAPMNGFMAKPKAVSIVIKHVKKVAKKPKKVVVKVIKGKTVKVKKVQVHKIKKLKPKVKTPKLKNDRLIPREGIPVYDKNPYLFIKGHIPPPSGIDVLESVRYAHMLVEQGDIASLKKLVANTEKFPRNGFNYGFSVFDKRSLTKRAMLKKDKKLLESVQRIEKDAHKKDHHRETLNENCILKKMTTGIQNIHMLGHRTAQIEMTRGSRQGNNALILHDNIYVEHETEADLVYEAGDNLDLATLKKLRPDGPEIDSIIAAIRAGNRKLAADIIDGHAKYFFNDLHVNSLKLDNQPLPKFMPISTTKKATICKRITPVHTAAINPNVKYLKEILAVEPIFNQADSESWYTIHYAAVCSGPEPLKYLIEKGAMPNIVNKHKESPLHCAARAGRTENVKILLDAMRRPANDKGVSDEEMVSPSEEEEAPKRKKPKKLPPSEFSIYLNGKSSLTLTPLHLAVKHDRHEVVKILLNEPEIQVDSSTSATQEKITPLMMACQRGDLEMVKILIDRGNAWIDSQDKFKRTPLIHATLGGQEHVAAELIRRGAGISSRPDSSGNSAAHYAAAYGWLNILKLLELAEPECLSAKNSWHLTPLMVAFLKNHMEIVSFFLDEKHNTEIDVNDLDNEGNSILLLVMKFEDVIGADKSLLERLKYLEEKNANVTITNASGFTPLHYFSSKPVKLQASKKGFVKEDQENKERLTREEYFEILDLLSKNRDPEIIAMEDEEGRTAFEFAVHQGNFLLAEALFTANQEAAISRWKKAIEEDKERGTTILHQFVDGIFSITKQARADDFSVLEYQNVFLPFLKKIIEKTKNIKVKVNDEEKSLLWALASRYDKQGRTPLLKFMRQARGFVIPPAVNENISLIAELSKLPVLEFARILIQIDKDFILWRELGNESGNNNNNNNHAHGGFFNQGMSFTRKAPKAASKRLNQNSSESSQTYRPNAFEITLRARDENFSHSFKLLNKERKMNNPLLKMVVEEIGNEKRIFEEIMMYQDNRFDFKGLSPLMFCVKDNLVNVICYLLSICEKFGLVEKVCSLILEKESIDGGNTYKAANKSILLLSIENKQLEVAEYLMTKTNLAKTVDEEGMNAFHYLAQRVDNIVEFFEMLQEHGLQFITDKKGRRPLHYAVTALQKFSATDISTDNLEFLLSADPQGLAATDIDLRTPIFYTFIPFEETWINRTVASNNQSQSHFGSTIPLNLIISSAVPEPMKSIENPFDSKKITKSDPIAIFSLLLKQMNASNLGKTDKYGNSILHYAAMAGANICLLTLLNKVKAVNVKNTLGNTPLALAVDNSHESATMTLIQAGANITDKFYGIMPKSVNPDSEKWKPWHMRSENTQQREETILSLVVRNGWQGIIYIILDKLDAKGDQVLVELLTAAVEHSQFNFAHTLIKKLKKIKNLTEPTYMVFEHYAKCYRGSENEQKLLEAMFEAGLSWTKPDGTSPAAEIFAKNCNVNGLGKLEILDEKYNGKKNWNKLLKSASANEIVKGFLKSWNGNGLSSLLVQVMHYIALFAGSDKNAFSKKLFEFYKPAFPGMEVISKKKPDPEIQHITALIYATQVRKYGLIQFLLSKLANINDVDEEGRTALMHALTGNDETAIRLLLKNKVDFLETSIEDSEDEHMDEDYPEEGSDMDDNDNDDEENSNYDDNEDSVIEDESSASEDGIPAPKKMKLIFKTKKAVRKEQPVKKPTKKSLPPLTFKNSDVILNLTDKAGNNLMHYFVTPNGYENTQFAKKLIQAEPKLVSLLTKQNKEGESPLSLAAKLKQKLIFKEFCSHLNKNQVDQKLQKKVEFESELAEVKKLACPFDIDMESSSFVERQMKVKRVVESEEDKLKRQRRPHKNMHNADTSEIVQDEETKELYKVLMHKTDVNYGMYGFHNYYRMQLAQRKRSNLFVLYTNWGRIGDEVGQCQHTPFSDLESAVKEFKSIFKQKSGNEWDEEFVEKPGKYRLVDIEEDMVQLAEFDINLKEKKSIENGESEEDKKVYELVKDISNVNHFREKWRFISSQVMNNLPFGRIKKAQLLKAREILDECKKLEKDKKKPNLPSDSLLKILDKQCRLSNELFMQIALGSFAFGRMTILDNENSIQNIEKLINQLWDFEIAAKFLTAAAGQTEMDAYKYIELGLESKFHLLNPESMEAQRILLYITNSSPDLKVTGIYSVLSKSSTENFEESGKDLHNHKLLWHGTRAENLLSILKVGLVTSPPHAYVTGNLYGEGIYFSDTFEKSRGYCHPSADGYYYALLCEVALGEVHNGRNTYELENTKSTIMEKKHTLKITGQRLPNDSFEVTTEKGIRMPLGKIMEVQDNNAFGYWGQFNEYIVKDRRNVNIRYLVQFKR